jgi:hypothetical protein
MQIVKKNLIWIMLLLTLAACFYVAQQEDKANQDEDEIVLVRTASKQVDSAEISTDRQVPHALLPLLRAQATDEPKNIFTVFVSEADLNQRSAEKPVEAPPANPFVFAGKLVDEGKIIVFLMAAQKNYSVVTGDILEEVWQVKSIVPPMMTIRYLPLKMDMQLQIGALS